MGLRAKKPEIKPPKRAKILVSGEAGVGKTYFSLQFPNVYYIDAEGGAERQQYQELLMKSDGVYVGREDGVSDFEEVIKEIKSLATEDHSYRTLVIDSVSQLYNDCAADAEMKVGNQFGANIKEANKPSRQLLRWIDKVDMNVILVAHAKSDWKNKDNQGNIGTTYDAFDKTAYHLDLWVEIVKKNMVVRKSRIEQFSEGFVFPREYKEFAQLFGQNIIDRETHKITLATDNEVTVANKLVKALGLNEDQVGKLFKKADVEDWGEMTHDQVVSCIKFLEKKLDE